VPLDPLAKDKSAGGEEGEDLACEASLGSLAGHLSFHLRTAQDACFQSFQRRFGRDDLAPGRYSVLVLIDANPGLTQTALSRLLMRDKSSLTPVLGDLRRRGLIEREQVASDRRNYALTLTAAGRALLEELRPQAEAHERLIERIVGPDQHLALLKTLRRLTRALAGDGGGSAT
jgi:DNA-binding MarR family transcriptional regulator